MPSTLSPRSPRSTAAQSWRSKPRPRRYNPSALRYDGWPMHARKLQASCFADAARMPQPYPEGTTANSRVMAALMPGVPGVRKRLITSGIIECGPDGWVLTKAGAVSVWYTLTFLPDSGYTNSPYAVVEQWLGGREAMEDPLRAAHTATDVLEARAARKTGAGHLKAAAQDQEAELARVAPAYAALQPIQRLPPCQRQALMMLCDRKRFAAIPPGQRLQIRPSTLSRMVARGLAERPGLATRPSRLGYAVYKALQAAQAEICPHAPYRAGPWPEAHIVRMALINGHKALDRRTAP